MRDAKLITSLVIATLLGSGETIAADNNYNLIDASQTDYNYNIVTPIIDINGNSTFRYYKLNINTDNLSSKNNLNWNSEDNNSTGQIEIIFNNDTNNLYFNYTETSPLSNVIHDTLEADIVNGRFGSFSPTVYSNYAIHNTKNYNVNIQADFLRNSIIDYTTTLSLYGGSIFNSGEINSISGLFIENHLNSSNSNTFGGAIYNEGKINTISSDFINNYTINGGLTNRGGAIYNKHLIDDLSGNFIGNHSYSTESSALQGGAIFNEKDINNITGNFIANYVSGENTIHNTPFGGALYNDSYGKIKFLNADFINNYAISKSKNSQIFGGAIYNAGIITKLEGDFIGNYISRTSTNQNETEDYVLGGAIYNRKENGIELINNKFIGNYAKSATSNNTFVLGGAIYSTKDITITADNGSTEFSGNYIKSGDNEKDYQAIYIDSNTAKLKLKATNNGEILFNDKISGNYGYKILVNGDNNSEIHLNNTIENANLTIENSNIYIAPKTLDNENTVTTISGGKIQLSDGYIANYSINNLSSSNNAQYSIDIDNSDSLALKTDTITTKTNSYGKIVISDINLQNSTTEFNAQILHTQDNNLQLDLTDDLKNKYNGTTTETLLTSDEMRADVNWKDTFKTYKQEKTTTSTLALDTINTTNDSITFSQATTLGQVVESGTAGDTLALLNQYETTDTRNFNFDNATDVYTVQSDLGTTSSGTININGVATETGHSTINGNSKTLFKLDNETDLNIKNVKIQNAASVVTGSNKDAEIVLNNVELKDNSSGIRTAGSVTIKGDSTLTNNGNGIEVTSTTSEITVDATDSEITLGDTLTGVRGARLNLNNGRVKVQKKISALDVMMNNAEVDMASDTLFNGQNITVNTESSLNMINNATSIMSVNTLTLKDTLNLAVDVDLANQSMDRIIASNYDLGSNVVNVNQMNLLTSTDRYKTDIPFADAGLKNSVTTSISEIAYSPIYKYNVAYSKDSGEFSFTRAGVTPVNPTPNNPNGGTTGGNSYDSYNPAVMASPVAAQLGGYMGMLDTYNNAFAHMDMYMLKPSTVRLAEQRQNQYAITESANVTYNGKPNEMNSKGVWVKPYASFDSVSLKDGPKADNFSYGSFIGCDSDMFKLKNGFYGVVSPYVAYQGSHQSYSGNSVYQNGGTVGVTGTFYKGNFFTGVTVGTGANISEASTMYGSEDFPMLMAGIANKTGYNFEFKDGRFIIQPNLQLSYTFVNTFDYTNGAGVRIESDPLHAIQVAPNVKFIMNTEGGWQPYATVGFRWNIMDETNFTAAESTLPEMSVKPYVNYGFGIQRTINDRLTAYGQIMLRHGGRNGIAANFGGRYMLGSESDPNANKHEL